MPWCIGLGSGGATGWPATDWVEDIMLRTQPPETYDKWATNEIPFNDPAVVDALQIFADIATNDKYVDGGKAAVAATDFRDSPKGLFGIPPKCYLHRFADYAAAVYGALRDRVANWTTLNEPWCAAFLGHAAGIHAPGVQDPATAVRAAHHLLLAHGQATRAMRAIDAGPRLGINLNLDPVTPASDGPADADAAPLSTASTTACSSTPCSAGATRPTCSRTWAAFGGLEEAGDDDLAAIAAPLDLLGVNYYRRWVVAARPERPSARRAAVALGRRRGRRGSWPANGPGPTWAGRSTHRACSSCCGGCTPSTPRRRCT